MLLIGCPLDKARQIADDVCRAVSDYRFVWKDKIFNIGVSVGLVEISRESGTLEELLAAADSACYVAKKQGSGAWRCTPRAMRRTRATPARSSGCSACRAR